MGVGRDKRSCFRHSNGLTSTFSIAFEHAFLEDVCQPLTRLFPDAISCDAYDSLHTQSYACRALLPRIEREDAERRVAIRTLRRRHSPYHARRALAVLASAGAIHIPPDVRHDDLIQEARSNGIAVCSLNASELLRNWNLTHPTPTTICQPDCSPPDLLFRLFVWIENPGASALFRWLLPRLYALYGIDLRNVTHVARLTHCFGGGAAWRKYTQILSSGQTLSSRIGVCGPCPNLNCGHAKHHEVTFASNTSLPTDAINIKHSIPPKLYDAQMAPLARAIPRSIRHQYLVVHLGSGSQSSRHITTLGFPVAFVDYPHTVTTNFRSVNPTLCTNYDTHPCIVHVVQLAARRAGFHPDAVVGVLFDPCCVTRSPITNMNRLHRYPSGQPFPAPDGDEAQQRDDRDALHIANLDCYSVQRDTRIATRTLALVPM